MRMGWDGKRGQKREERKDLVEGFYPIISMDEAREYGKSLGFTNTKAKTTLNKLCLLISHCLISIRGLTDEHFLYFYIYLALVHGLSSSLC